MIQEAYEAYEAKFRDVLHEAKIFFADDQHFQQPSPWP
jgi:hypothetical protein